VFCHPNALWALIDTTFLYQKQPGIKSGRDKPQEASGDKIIWTNCDQTWELVDEHLKCWGITLRWTGILFGGNGNRSGHVMFITEPKGQPDEPLGSYADVWSHLTVLSKSFEKTS